MVTLKCQKMFPFPSFSNGHKRLEFFSEKWNC